ncbi:MAG: RNB domain-containing ribonuclease, partial [Deltaproteobacteria bacterium]|nr:RNB domain-containing ribonuclease [Deltaproteobacteria bacterium]
GIALPVGLQELWQLVVDEGGLNFSAIFLADLCFGGSASDDEVAALLRAVFNDKLYFKYKNGELLAHTPEAVEQLLAKREEEGRQEAMLVSGAAALRELWEGKTVTVPPDCLELLRDYYLFDKEADDFLVARELLKRAGLTTPHAIFHLLVKCGQWSEHENIPLLRAQLPLDFSNEAKAQTTEIIARLGSEDLSVKRADLRGLPIFTVDGPSTRDFDDALHVTKLTDGNFEVGIHISDVAHSIIPGSPLYREAEARTTSLYFADGTVPMLPPELSEGALSLLADQDRAALSYIVTLTPAGALADYRIVKSVINVKRQLTYEEAENLLSSDSDLQDLAMLSRCLYDNRIEAGALVIPIPDVVCRFGVDGAVERVDLLPVDTPMRLMVAEFMVMANSLAARFLADRQEPGLFRSQGPARKRFFKRPDNDIFILFRQRRFLSRGILDTTPKRHDGVGVEQYTTTTSPIRRLLDLVMQRQISGILAGRGAQFSELDLRGIAHLISAAQSRLNQVRQQRHRYWLLHYLEKHQDGRLAAFVLDKRNRKVQVVLKDFLLEGELPANQGVHHELGDSIMVKPATVNALDNKLRLEW